MTLKALEDLMPTDEELLEQGIIDPDQEELDAREARRQKEADGLEESNIVGE
jgi:hypothetical protein